MNFPFGCRTALLLQPQVFLISGFIAASAAQPVHLARTPDEGLQPQVVTAEGSVHLVYLSGDPAACDVFYRVRPPGQTNFSPAVRVNSTASTAIAIGSVRGAQLARGGDRLHVVWNGSSKAKPRAGLNSAMLYTRFNRATRQFEPERNLMTHTINLDGGGSVAADSAGNVYVVWHAHEKGDSGEDESHRGVYVAYSSDFGATFASERKISGPSPGVCGCCGLKAFAPAPGQIAVIYRSADAVGNRDMVLMRSTNSGQSFDSRALGKWKVSTCPMSTPDLCAGPDGRLAAMWETDGQVFRASLSASKLDGPIALTAASGNPQQRKHPRLGLSQQPDGQPLVTWVEGTGWEKGGALAWELPGSPATSARVDGVRPWTFAAVFGEPDGSYTILY